MGKKLYGYHYASIWIVMLAVALVGYAGVGHHPNATAADDADTFNAVLGLFFIIAAQILCALQIVVEEHMMLALNVSPMLLVGFEGLWGLVFYVILVPVLTLTPATGSAFATTWHEDFIDSFVQVKNSPTLIVLILVYIVAVGTLNVTGNYVTKHLSAVMRSITETLRTLGVWTLSLFVYYVVHTSPGEQWTTSSWSFFLLRLELLGFVLMVYGTLAYKQLIHLPVSKLYEAEHRELRRGREDTAKSPFNLPVELHANSAMQTAVALALVSQVASRRTTWRDQEHASRSRTQRHLYPGNGAPRLLRWQADVGYAGRQWGGSNEAWCQIGSPTAAADTSAASELIQAVWEVESMELCTDLAGERSFSVLMANCT